MDPCPVLIGREKEMAALRALLDAGGGVAIVSGEAGIGKSRLVREFAAEAASRGRVVLWGRPEEVAQPGPYALIVDLLESIAERGDASVRRDARSVGADLLRQLGSEELRPIPSPRAVAAEIRGLVAQLGASPLIVFEDLHWADEASHSIVLHASRAALDDGHTIVTTVRSERISSGGSVARLVDSLTKDRVATVINVEPLSDQEMAGMLSVMWGRQPLPEELSEFRRLGEGVPFFIEEIAASASTGGTRKTLRSVEQTVAARLRELGSDGETVVRMASLLAGAIDTTVLALALDIPEEVVTRSLSNAARIGMLVDVEGRLVFRHALVRESVATSMVSVAATQAHARLAFAIEKTHANELDAYAETLAWHYRDAGDPFSAAQFAVRAGNRALALGSIEEARTAYSLAIEQSLNESIEAIEGLGEVEFRDAHEESATRLFRQAAEKFKEHGQRREAALALGRLAWSMLARSPAESVMAVLDEGLRLLEDETSSLEYAQLTAQKGSIMCFHLNNAVEAQPILESALELAAALGDETQRADALDALAQAADQRGHLEEALKLGAMAVEASKRGGDPEVIGRSHHNHAIKLASVGQPSAAIIAIEEGRDRLRKAYGRAAIGALDVGNAWIFSLMGRPNEVASMTARGRSAWQRWRGYRWVLDTWASIERGEIASAEATVSGAWQEVGRVELGPDIELDKYGISGDVAQVVHAEAMLLLAKSETSRALAMTSALIEGIESSAESFDVGQLLALHARALLLEGLRDEASETMARLETLLADHPYPYIHGLLVELTGLIENADVEKRASRFAEAEKVFVSCENVSDRTRCAISWVELRIGAATGESKAELVDALKEIRAIAIDVGARSEANRAEAVLRKAGVRPRAGRPRKTAGPQIGGLSPREVEVVALVAAGDTNATIAARLFISERTVQDHITHALARLGLHGRAALASWAVKQGMI